jgi:sterol desaturase/sphingolipid hydroxylase (fatty acid hydroxylase superfamily)
MNRLLEHVSDAYALVFFGSALVLAVVEWAAPRREAGDALRVRWVGNVALAFLNAFLVRALFPMIGVVWASFCVQRGWGVFNHVQVPSWLPLVATVLVLDAGAYAEHATLHQFPLLWRLHRTHHTDHEVDLTTGIRFHPLEAVLTTAVTLVLVALLGAPPAAVLVSQLLTIAVTFFEHANIRVPATCDRVLRWIVVTPDLHRTHHSMDRQDSRANFGAVFPWWDWLFGTYRDQPGAGHERIAFGVKGFRDRRHLSLPWMIVQPLLRPERQERQPSPLTSDEVPGAPATRVAGSSPAPAR